MSAERRRCRAERSFITEEENAQRRMEILTAHLSMKEKTPNPPPPWTGYAVASAQRRTLNIEWSPRGVRLCEIPTAEYGDNKSPPKYDLENRLLDFAVNVVELTESLPSTRSGNHIAGQLLRCGTSPLSNHGEVEAAESRKDFLHKLRICLEELRETKRWLLWLGAST
jgi:four helix bundle protein